MRHGEIEFSQSFEWFGSGGDSGGQTSTGIGCSIRPGTAVPHSVLVSDMVDGSLLLEGWRNGPSAYLSPADAMPLRRQLAAAFGSSRRTSNGDQGETR